MLNSMKAFYVVMGLLGVLVLLSGCVFTSRFEIYDNKGVNEKRTYYGQSYMDDVKSYKVAE